MGVLSEQEVFKIHGDVRFAGSVTGAVRWRQGYLSLCQDSKSTSVWACYVYYEARDRLPASDYKLSQRSLQTVPKNPEKAEKSGFIQFIMYNGSNIWIKRNSRSQRGSFFRFAELLCGIKNGILETKRPASHEHIGPSINGENVIPIKVNGEVSVSELNYREKTPPRCIIRRHTLSSEKMLQKSISRRRISSADYEESGELVVVNGSYSTGGSPFYRKNPDDRYYKKSDVLDSSYTTPTKTSPDTSLKEQYSIPVKISSNGVLALLKTGEESIASNKENCIIKRTSPSSRKNIALKFLKEGQLKGHTLLEGDNTKPSISPPKTETVNMLTSTERFYSKDPEMHVRSNASSAESNSQSSCQFGPLSKTPPKRSPLSEIFPSAKRWKSSQSPVDRTAESSNEESVCDKSSTQIAGFTNIGNSCYMNSVLQALFAIRCFTDDLLDAKQVDDELPESSLCRHLANLLLAKLEGTSKHYHLENVKEAVVSMAPWFGGTDQHDAHEFLGQVLDQLKEEINRIASKINQSDENEKDPLINPVQQNFEFEMINSYMCQGCREVVGRKETFLMLSLDVPGCSDSHITESVQDALDSYFKPEKLQFCCEKCHAKDACCVQTFTKLPRVLVLHLKRYSYSQLSVKVAQPVIIPTVLSLHKHVQESTLPPPPVTRSRHTSDLIFSMKATSDDSAPVEMPENIATSPARSLSLLENDEEELSAEDIEKMSDHDRLLLAIERSKRDSIQSEHKEILSSPVSVGLKGGRKEGPLSILPPPAEVDSGSLSDCPTEKYVAGDDDYDSKAENKESTDETDKDQVQAALQMSLQDVQRQEEIELRKALQISMQDMTVSSDCTENTTLLEETNEETTSLASLEVEDLPFSYQLTGIVSHIGQTAQSGHYLCDVCDVVEDTWWHVNDDVVQKKQKEEVLSERRASAYLLFYVAKEALPSQDLES